MSAFPKIADFISRFEFSYLCFLAFSVPFSSHALRDFKEEISNNLYHFSELVKLFIFNGIYFHTVILTFAHSKHFCRACGNSACQASICPLLLLAD